MPRQTVFIVDDDPAVRDSTCALLESAGFEVQGFNSAKRFLADYEPGTGQCLVADIRMPGMGGMELLQELRKRHISLPVIVITGHGDVPLAVRAMKAGAADFIEKPFDDDAFIESIRRALNSGGSANPVTSLAQEAEARIATLTARERQVLEQLVLGHPNKVIAYELQISPRTVEIHRAHVMEKMKVRSLPELVRLALAAGLGPSE